MAVSQSITLTQSSQSVSGNYSNVTFKWTSTQSGESYNNYTKTAYYYISINGGAETKHSVSYTLPKGTTKTIVSKTIKVNHKTNGQGSIKIRTYMSTGISAGVIEKSKSLTLDTIPRASTMSVPTMTIGSAGTIPITRASSNFTHTITVTFDSYSETISGVTTSASFTPPLSWLNAIPNAKSGTATYEITTYDGSTSIGSKTYTATLNAPSSGISPNVSSVTTTEVTSGLASKFGAFIKGKSKIKFGITASGQYGAKIATCSTTFNGETLTGFSPTSELIKSSGSLSYTVTVTDTRGNSTSYTKSITVLDYSNPSLSLSANRCNSDGTINDEGTHVSITFSYSITALNNKNNKSYKIEMSTDGTSWTQLNNVSGTAISGSSSYSLSTTVITSSVFNSNNRYMIRLTVTDYFNSELTKTHFIPTAFTLVDYYSTGKGIAFGKVAERDGIEIALNTYVSTDVSIQGEFALSCKSVSVSNTLKVSGVSTQGRINASNIYLSGSLYVGGKTSSTDGKNGVAFGASGNVFMQGNNPTICFLQAGKGGTVGARIFITNPDDGYTYLKFKADSKYLVFREAKDEGYTYSSYFYGETDGGTTLGTSGFRFYRLYATNSSISTSDKRQKENIKALRNAKKRRKKDDGKTEEFDVYSELFDKLEPVEYNFINGQKRKDFGLLAQDVLETMLELGLAEDELDLVHHDTWIDEKTGEEKDTYGIAYENLIALLICEVQKLKERVNQRER